MQPQNPAVAPWYFDWIRHSTRDDFWRQFSIRERYPSVKVPVLHFEGWYDAFLAGGTENFAGMVAHGGTELARDNQRLVIGPWDHVNWGRPDSIAGAAAQGHRRGRRQSDQRPDAGLVRPLPEGAEHRRRRETPGRLLRHGCQHLEVRDELASAADKVDDVLPVGAGRNRRPQGATRIRRARRPAAGHLHLRPRIPGAEPGRSLLLRCAVRPAGTVRPVSRRAAIRRPGLQQRADSTTTPR